MKYLSKFKWMHLTEKIAYEKRIKEKRLRTEIAHIKPQHDGTQRIESHKHMDMTRHINRPQSQDTLHHPTTNKTAQCHER